LHDLYDSDAGLRFLFLNFVVILTMKNPIHYPAGIITDGLIGFGKFNNVGLARE